MIFLKIAFVSDFHLGFNDDALAQAEEALKLAVERADLVVMAGDLFDTRVPKQEVVHDAIKLFSNFNALIQDKSAKAGYTTVFESESESGGRPLQYSGVPLIAIYGTHERRTKGLVNIIQLLHSAGLMLNVHAAKATIAAPNGEKVCVQGIGGIPEEFAARAIEAMSFTPLSGAFNVFIFHQTLRELISVADGISATDLPGGFDVYVDGHIHWAKQLKEAGREILLPGSTVVTQMKKNEVHPKGFYLYDSKARSAEFVAIRARPFEMMEVAFKEANASQIEALCRKAVEEAAARHKGVLPLVKVKLSGTLARGTTASSVDLSHLEKEFAEKMFLSIERDFASDELREKIELLRQARGEQQSARELGLSSLKQRLAPKMSASQVEELFELLSEGSVDAVLKQLVSRK